MRASLGRDRVSFKASKIRDGLDFTSGHDLVFFFRLFLSIVRSQKKHKKKMSKKKFLFLKQQSAKLLSFVSLMY